MIFFIILSRQSKLFKKETGIVSFKDFWKLKYQYIYNSFLSIPILFATIFIKGESTDLMKYFKEEHDFSLYTLIFLLFINSLVVMSFFISKEKNTLLFTQLISDTKFIFITLISYCVLKFFIFTWKNKT